MKHKKTVILVAFIAVLFTALGFQTQPEYKIFMDPMPDFYPVRLERLTNSF